MSTAATPITANQLTTMRTGNGKRYELVLGELRVMSPVVGQHGRIAMRSARLLANHVDEHRLGEVFAAETGFLLTRDPDTVRAPDASFVNAAAFSELSEVWGFLSVTPDLAIEVVSPSDTSTQVEEKAQAWLHYGNRLVLVVDPATQSILAYREPSSIDVSFVGDSVDASDVVDGWQFSVDEVF